MLAGALWLFPPLAALHLPAGGDHPVHLSRAVFLAGDLARLDGFCDHFYLGFPFGPPYAPGGSLLIALLHLVPGASWPAAYSLALLVAMALPPLAAAALARGTGGPFAAWLAAAALLLDRGAPWVGGFDFALRAGVWPFCLCLGLTLLALLALDRCATAPGPGRICVAALAVFAAPLFHPAALLFLAVAAPCLALVHLSGCGGAAAPGPTAARPPASAWEWLRLEAARLTLTAPVPGRSAPELLSPGAARPGPAEVSPVPLAPAPLRLRATGVAAAAAAAILGGLLDAFFLVPALAWAGLADPQPVAPRALATVAAGLASLHPLPALPAVALLLGACSAALGLLSGDRRRLLLAATAVAALLLATAEAAPLWGLLVSPERLQLPRLEGLSRVLLLVLAADGAALLGRLGARLLRSATHSHARLSARLAAGAAVACGAVAIVAAAAPLGRGLAADVAAARSLLPYSDTEGPWADLRAALAATAADEEARGLPRGARIAFADGALAHLSGAVPALTGRAVLRDAWTPTVQQRGRFVELDATTRRLLGVHHLLTALPGLAPEGMEVVGRYGRLTLLVDSAPGASPVQLEGGEAEVDFSGAHGSYRLSVAAAGPGAVAILPLPPHPRFQAEAAGEPLPLLSRQLRPGRGPEALALPLRVGQIRLTWVPRAPERLGRGLSLAAAAGLLVLAWLALRARRAWHHDQVRVT